MNGIFIFNYATTPIPAGLSNQKISLNMITDGMSNTLMIGEKHVPIGQIAQGLHDSSVYNGDHGASVRFIGPNHPVGQTDLDPSRGFGSQHSGVWNAVLCDGSVRSIQKSTNSTILAQLATRAGGEVGSDF